MLGVRVNDWGQGLRLYSLVMITWIELRLGFMDRDRVGVKFWVRVRVRICG